MKIQVFIVEDHPFVQKVLGEFIARIPGFAVCDTRQSAEDALAALENASPDLMLIDMSLPSMSGADLVRILQKERPTLPCVLLSGHNEAAYVRQALSAGARGYILKGAPEELQGALEKVLSGEIYLSKELMDYA